MFDWLFGRGKVKVQGVSIPSPKSGILIPAVHIAIRHRWFDWRVSIIDMISFLVIAEKMAEWRVGDFQYDHDHDGTRINVEFPEWAMGGLLRRVSEVAPKIYDALKEIDKKAQESIAAAKAEMTLEQIEQLPVIEGAIAKYRKLHAKVNGYTWPSPAANDEGKTLHQAYCFPTWLKL